MQVIEVDTLILGATFYGCGLAAGLPGALVAEAMAAPGSDAVFGFDPGTGWDRELRHPDAGEFRAELRRRHALTPEGRLLTGALAPVFADWCRRRGLVPRLGLSAVEIREHSVVFMDLCGTPLTCRARQIIDAREPERGGKFLTASLYSETALPEGEIGGFQITGSGIDRLYYLALPLEETVDWPEARSRLFLQWHNRPAPLREARIELIAPRFSYRHFANAAAALDAGLAGTGKLVRSDTGIVRDVENCDVIVVGFGTAGSSAAVAAGRRGMRVMAIERSTYPGGTWTGGFLPHCYLQKPVGLAAEFYREAARIEGCAGLIEPLKLVQERAALECGVDLRYGATLMNVIRDGDRVCGIVWRDPAGTIHTTRAAVVVDATAEAAVCRLAGCELSCGRSSDREFNNFTASMGVRHADHAGVANFDAGRVAQYDPEDFSRNYLTGLTTHLRADYRTGQPCLLLADQPGLREGERIIPERPYTIDEFFATGGTDPEPLFQVVSNLDTHTHDLAFESELFQDWIIAASLWEVRLAIPVPRRVLFPRHSSGLLAAGRHLGVDHSLGCAIRMIPAMAAVGEAAGIIAARAIVSGVAPDRLPYADFAAELPLQSENSAAINAAWSAMPAEEIKAQLSGTTPGPAIWNLRQQHLSDLAAEWFISSPAGSELRSNCALALALLGDMAAVPELLAIVATGGSRQINAGWSHTHAREEAAVYLLGRLRAAAAVPLLLRRLVPADRETGGLNNATVALIKIGDAHAECRSDVAPALRRLAEDPDWQLFEMLNGRGAGRRRADGLLRLHIARALDRWQVPHRIAAVAAQLELDWHEKWLWQNQAAPITLQTSTQER